MVQNNLQELLSYLDEYLKVRDFKDYCPNGLQVEGKRTLAKVAFSPSASLEVIEKAIAENVDALIVHHGLFWNKEPVTLKGALYRKIKMLMEHDISLLAYHLPLDAHPEVGNNFETLRNLGFSNIKSFESIGAMAEGSIEVNAFEKKVEHLFNFRPKMPPCKISKLNKVACVSGGGHALIKEALNQGCDGFISGTQDEWVWDFAQENKVAFFPLGHYLSETVGVNALMNHLKSVFEFKSILIKTDNPY